MMRLGLSSAALPDASLDMLMDAAATRGLDTIELRAGDGHGVDAFSAGLARTRASAQGITIAGYYTTPDANTQRLVHLAEALSAPVLVAPTDSLEIQLECVRRVTDAGGAALAVVTGPADGWLGSVVRAGVAYAWEIEPAATNVAADVEAVVGQASAALRCIRFIGGGPETATQSGHGVGLLMARLALTRYQGPLILVPSSARYRIAWASWLGRRGGCGCGSKAVTDGVIPIATLTGGQT